jgi:hypothetical protein
MTRLHSNLALDAAHGDGRALALAGAAVIAALMFLGFLALPAAAHTDVQISVNLGGPAPPPHIVFDREPGLRPVPRTGVYFVAGYPDYDVYRYGPAWYACREGIWFRASSWRGPWIGIRTVPYDVIYAPRGYYHARHLPPGQLRRGPDDRRGRDYARGRGYDHRRGRPD